MSNRWWGIIKSNQDVELRPFEAGDNARIRRAYMNESEIDFVIEPFVAESFDDAKVWVRECVNFGMHEAQAIISQMRIDKPEKTE